jgi:hypothetical protein
MLPSEGAIVRSILLPVISVSPNEENSQVSDMLLFHNNIVTYLKDRLLRANGWVNKRPPWNCKEGYILRKLQRGLKLRRGARAGKLKSIKIKIWPSTSLIDFDHPRFISH